MPSIFICYRRDDSSAYAGRLYDHLSAHFGATRVFMDIDTIRPGDDFVQVISDKVAACDVLIAVIGKRWLVPDGRGVRRIDDPADFVRIEIVSALNRQVRVIPALVDGAQMPRLQDLPRDLAALSRRNAIELTHTQFRQNVTRLMEIIEETVGPKTPFFRNFGKKPEAQRAQPQVRVAARTFSGTAARLQQDWPLLAGGAAFLLLEIFGFVQWQPHPSKVVVSTILQAAALFAILAKSSSANRASLLKLTACWCVLGLYWLIAVAVVIRPIAGDFGPGPVGIAIVILQAAAAVVFGFLARRVQPAISQRSIVLLARTWGIGSAVVWLMSLRNPWLSPALLLFSALEGASTIWFLRRAATPRG